MLCNIYIYNGRLPGRPKPIYAGRIYNYISITYVRSCARKTALCTIVHRAVIIMLNNNKLQNYAVLQYTNIQLTKRVL